MLLALAMVLSYVEAMIPINIGVPGVKLGLPNIVTVIGLYSIGALPTLVISFLRILLVSFMFGNTMTLAYSIAGFALSFGTMLLMRKVGKNGDRKKEMHLISGNFIKQYWKQAPASFRSLKSICNLCLTVL